jgi:hypothetical protein
VTRPELRDSSIDNDSDRVDVMLQAARYVDSQISNAGAQITLLGPANTSGQSYRELYNKTTIWTLTFLVKKIGYTVTIHRNQLPFRGLRLFPIGHSVSVVATG